jgi:hypothetical protein
MVVKIPVFAVLEKVNRYTKSSFKLHCSPAHDVAVAIFPPLSSWTNPLMCLGQDPAIYP